MPSLTAMSQQQINKNTKFKRMKHLFLIFLKQFEVDEYKLLIQFLQLIIDKYNVNPSKLFGFLTSQDEISLDDVVNQKLNVSNKNLSNILNKIANTNSQSVSQVAQPIQQVTNMQPKLAPPSNLNDSPFRRSLRINSAKLAQSLNKSKANTDTKYINIKEEMEEVQETSNLNEIIDSFVMKENEDYENANGDQWETFNETTNQNFSDDSANDMGNNSNTNVQHNKSNNANNSNNRIRKFSDRVRNELERSFLANNFITGGEKKVLAKRLNLTERQVSKWFVHRREKLRRLEKRASNINSTLQEHYKTQQSQQTNEFYNDNNEQNDINNDEYYNDNADEEENWFNDLQTNENNQNHEIIPNEEVDQSQENNFDDYNEYNEDAYVNGEYNDYQSSNESDEQQYSTLPNANNKRYSLDSHNIGTKRVCLNQTSELDDFSNKPQRRLFPPHVISHLESIFDNEKYLKDDQVSQISRETNLSEKQIRSWFKQRRYRYNQENKQNGIDIEIKKYNNLSANIVSELEKAFNKNNYVYGNDKKILARKLNLTPVQLERWFYYRRKKQSNSAIDSSNIINETF